MTFRPKPNRRSTSDRTPNTLARYLFESYPRHRVEHLQPQNCKHNVIIPEIQTLVEQSSGRLSLERLGTSLEGRSISLITCGTGKTRIILWSQMHGDESTATLALLDALNFLLQGIDEEKWIREMLGAVTLHIVPMLNPDGAERVQRRTVQNIDMNRDAMALATPEAQILHTLRQRLKPQFGFNLHDQEPASVGDTNEVAAIALLAPALDFKRSTPLVRTRAIRMAALIARVLSQFVPRNLSRYPDDFDPRAFGDAFQAAGTSTVLIESGHAISDPEKKLIRKLNFVGILTALRCIANGSYQDAELDLYYQLPENNRNVFDFVVRNVRLHHHEWAHRVDIGLAINRSLSSSASTTIVTVKDMGDLHTFVGLETIDGKDRHISSSFLQLEQSIPLSRLLDELQLPA